MKNKISFLGVLFALLSPLAFGGTIQQNLVTERVLLNRAGLYECNEELNSLVSNIKSAENVTVISADKVCKYREDFSPQAKLPGGFYAEIFYTHEKLNFTF